MKKFVLLFLSIILCGCAHDLRMVSYSFYAVDNPSMERIDLKVISHSDFELCLYPDNWPNQAGAVDQASESIYLYIDDVEFSYEDINTGYCPGCRTVINPRGAANAYLLYKDFNIDENLKRRTKVLEFSPRVSPCDP